MNIRNYNIYFHTHTISGIIITAILYVIFFAGSFAFFKSEISNWQKNTPNDQKLMQATDYNVLADSLDKTYQLYGRDLSFYFNEHARQIRVSVSASKDTLNPKAKERSFFSFDPVTRKELKYDEGYDLGEFMYRLHFLAPVNGVVKLGFPIGYYIAGIVAVMFLFALITGLLLHWDKIISNFYIFRPWEKLKTVWTDLHTALGVISFPFLLVFSITGAYFLITSVLFMPAVVQFEYGGNEDSLYADLGYKEHVYEFKNEASTTGIDFRAYLDSAYTKWGKNVKVQSLQVLNYGDRNMHLVINGTVGQSKKLTSKGWLIYNVESGKLVDQRNPMSASSYADIADNLLYVLHFGSYGGFAVKILYFLLGICGCVVIVSGVLIWQKARDKKSTSEHKRKFNNWLTNIYLSICLSMYPVTAAAFIVFKIFPDKGQAFTYQVYFWSWLAMSILLVVRRNNYKTNRDCLLLGSILGLLVPVANGVMTGNWIWNSFKSRYHDILLVDVFWLLLSVSTLLCWRLVVKKHKATAAAAGLQEQ